MDKFISPGRKPTEREREVVEIIIEECSEVQQRSTKLLRFGPTEVQPEQPYDNCYRLGLEVGDLLEILDVAVKEGLIPQKSIDAGRANKKRQLARFMQTTKE